jgi:hypothetical protein
MQIKRFQKHGRSKRKTTDRRRKKVEKKLMKN